LAWKRKTNFRIGQINGIYRSQSFQGIRSTNGHHFSVSSTGTHSRTLLWGKS